MRIPHSLCLALVVGLLSSACATERTPVSADPTQPSTTPDVALATTVSGGEVTEPQATTAALISTTTTTIAAALEPVEEEPPADIGEWTPERALAMLGDVCSQPIEGRGTLDDWTPKFWLLCNVVAVGPSGGVPDMWGFNAECEDLPDVESALRCIVYDLVNYMIIDYQILELSGDPSETWWLWQAAQADLRARCEHLVSSEWGDDEGRERCAEHLSSLPALEPEATVDGIGA